MVLTERYARRLVRAGKLYAQCYNEAGERTHDATTWGDAILRGCWLRLPGDRWALTLTDAHQPRTVHAEVSR